MLLRKLLYLILLIVFFGVWYFGCAFVEWTWNPVNMSGNMRCTIIWFGSFFAICGVFLAVHINNKAQIQKTEYYPRGFLDWVTKHYIKLDQYWVHKYGSQTKSEEWKTTKQLINFYSLKKNKTIKGYKILTNDMKSPWDRQTKWEINKVTKLNNNRKLKIAKNGLHLYKSLSNVSIEEFAPRIFEAEIIGAFKEDNNKLVGKKIKLIKELKPEEVKDSLWCYLYCKNIKDNPNVRKNIVKSEYAYWYCRNVKDRKDIRKNIVNSEDAYWYCIDVKNRSEVAKYITDSKYAYFYCKHVKDRREISKNITDPYWLKKYNELQQINTKTV